MTRLRDAANETHMAYLAQFFPETNAELPTIPEAHEDQSPLLSGGPIVYSYELEAGCQSPREMLTFNLRKLDGDKKFMTDSLRTFGEDLKHWKRYSEDLKFVGDYSPWRHRRDD